MLTHDLPISFVLSISAVVGLIIGSFINVVVYRLPKMMQKQWENEVAEVQGQVIEQSEKFNLALPRSRCSSCGHTILWYENIPVVSYIFLKGKCSQCGVAFGLRYPLVETAASLLFLFCTWRGGSLVNAFIWCVFSSALLALALIDWDSMVLPDAITLPLLWFGLIAAALHFNPLVQLPDAMWGAVLGYMSLWAFFHLHKLITGKEGMGYGDFKLLACSGVWFGWTAVLPIIFMSSIIGITLTIAMKFPNSLRKDGAVPFGPSLVIASFLTMIFGLESILGFLRLLTSSFA
jgi:leader peptidase (prepilin peptidase)/N-methyltransferase